MLTGSQDTLQRLLLAKYGLSKGPWSTESRSYPNALGFWKGLHIAKNLGQAWNINW